MIPVHGAVREHSTRYGGLVVALGIVSLLALRVWTSPIGQRITGRQGVSLAEYLLIPVFLGLVAAGIVLFLWEPT